MSEIVAVRARLPPLCRMAKVERKSGKRVRRFRKGVESISEQR
jgi:hypothetical protein